MARPELAVRLEQFFRDLDLPPDGRGYVNTHIRRLVQTLMRVPPSQSSGRGLEMGSYLHMASAMHLFLGYGDVRAAYYGTLGETKSVGVSLGGREVFRCDVDGFDAERDRFPYEDGSFETVLACEIIEHLIRDPIHMLSEIHRVLEIGGTMVLTTPNVVSLTSLAHALKMDGHPQIYALYPPVTEGRDLEVPHVHEYTPYELEATVRAAGFAIDSFQTERIETIDTKWVERLLRKNRLPTNHRGEQMYCIARKVKAEATPDRPGFLYDYGD